MSIRDAKVLNNRYQRDDENALERSAAELLEQVGKIDPAEVEGLIIAVKNRDGVHNLFGLCGALPTIQECLVESILRYNEVRSASPRNPANALNPEDVGDANQTEH